MAPRSAVSRRRSDLAEGGDAGPGVAAAADGTRGARLRRRLLAAGPLAARFGIYLGSRVDLLSGTDCLRLLEIPDRGEPSPFERVAALVERELGERPEKLFEAFDGEPCDSGLLLQWHRARLPGGERVTVELVHPELESALDDGELRALTERLIGDGELPAGARPALAEFEPRLDLRRAADSLAELALETDGARWVEVPAVHHRLCSRRIRVLAALDGRAGGAAADAGDGAGSGARRARRLGRVWLAMALGGDLFPAEPWGRNLAWLEGGRVAFLDGDVHRLPRSCRGDLREYLAAVAARQPARAALALLDLLPDGAGNRRLRDRLRHTDPFRDRGWDVGGDLFVRQVLAHWHTARELGYRLPEGVVPFYRGLFLLNQEVRRLAADGASVRDGLREARLLLLAGELRDEGESGRWSGTLERQLSLLGGLPQKLDRILTLAASEDRADDRQRDRRRPLRRRGAGAVVAACLLGLTAVVLLTHHLGEAGPFGAAAEQVGAVVFLALGALLLRVAAGSGDG